MNYAADVEEAGTTGIEPAPASGLSRGTVVKAVPAAALTTVAVIFAIQNLDSIDVDFLAWSFELPLVVIMAASAIFGAAVLALVGFRRRRLVQA